MTQPDAAELAARAAGLIGSRSAGSRAILGITGPPGAGKSTLADLVIAQLNRRPFGPGLPGVSVAHVPMDGFHLADAQLERLGLVDRKGAPETFDDAGYAATLRRIATSDTEVYVPGFERDLEQPLAAAMVVPAEATLVVTEGNYLLLDCDSWPAARSTLAEVWYCELPDAVRRDRLIARHVEFGKSLVEATRWVDRSDEANARLVAEGKGRADLVVRMG